MGVIRTCEIRNQTVRLDLDSEQEEGDIRNYELWRAGHYATKEPDTLDWIDTWFQEDNVIYDVGGNIGQYSLYAARKLSGRAKILTFEPEALNFGKLNRNIVLNGVGDTITPYCLALSDRTAIDCFYSRAFTTGASLHALGRKVTQGEKPFEPHNCQGVMAVALDDLTGEFGLPFPNHIKVDVDGIEARIVAGAARTLTDPRLRTFLIEIYMLGEVAEEIKSAFFTAGFELSNAEAIDYSEGTVQNLIFTRKGAHPREALQ